MKNKKGFTLIELLAVIIILGILMIIAIPSVTKYINDSRKESYVDSAKEIIGSARNLVNSGDLEMYDTNTTYYIDVKCINTENASKSPYGDFVQAYVVVTYDGKGYDYYWTSVDEAGQGIKKIIRFDKLNPDNIESDLTSDDISTYRGIDGREYIVVVSKANDCKKQGSENANIQINGETGEEISAIEYPEGKTKETVEAGEIVKIENEEFYVVKHNGNDLILLSRYNLNVGNHKKEDAPEGIQDSEVKGKMPTGTTYGNVSFSSTYYWDGKVGEGLDYPGIYCTSATDTGCAIVYDSNCYLKAYVDAYKTYLEGLGAKIKEARLMTLEESYAFRDVNKPAWQETSYWLESAYSNKIVWIVTSSGGFSHYVYNFENRFGVRPVIVI